MMISTIEAGGATRSNATAALRSAGLCERVFGWDLAPILRSTAARLGWSASYAAAVEQEYRHFLYLSIMHPDDRLGMAGPVDELWHDHILSTRNYVDFCRQAAGSYLHHTPTGDAGGSGSEYARTLALMEQHFGEPNWAVWPRAGASETVCCSNCTHSTDQGESLHLS